MPTDSAHPYHEAGGCILGLYPAMPFHRKGMHWWVLLAALLAMVPSVVFSLCLVRSTSPELIYVLGWQETCQSLVSTGLPLRYHHHRLSGAAASQVNKFLKMKAGAF